MTNRTLIPAFESIVYGAIDRGEPTTTEQEVLANPNVWQHVEYENPAADDQKVLKVWQHDTTHPSGYKTQIFIIK